MAQKLIRAVSSMAKKQKKKLVAFKFFNPTITILREESRKRKVTMTWYLEKLINTVKLT